MKQLFIVANWKSYKTVAETVEWIEKIKQTDFSSDDINRKEVVLCPQYPLLPLVKDAFSGTTQNRLSLRTGSQNISPFEEGAHTGEVTAKLLQEFCMYAIIGHSERRDHFGETDVLLAKKVILAQQYGISPIYCIQGKETLIPRGVKIAAYEPVTAIGTGNPDTPESAEEVAKHIKDHNHDVTHVLYGGSVKPGNVASFTAMEHIDGVLVGGSSLNSDVFIQVIKNA
jgi:triosephosphate isomerase (TIM)